MQKPHSLPALARAIFQPMTNWKPEREVDPDLARHLIESQFPELMPLQLAHIGTGWDNVAYRVSASARCEEWVFRFPQRQVAVEWVLREMKCLPILAASVAGIVKRVFLGSPDSRYPWPFFGYKPVPGQEARTPNLLRGASQLSPDRWRGFFANSCSCPNWRARALLAVRSARTPRFLKRSPAIRERFKDAKADMALDSHSKRLTWKECSLQPFPSRACPALR